MDLHLFSICSAEILMQQTIYLADTEKYQYWYDLVWDIVCNSGISLWKKKRLIYPWTGAAKDWQSD